jgi:hypothetical protein
LFFSFSSSFQKSNHSLTLLLPWRACTSREAAALWRVTTRETIRSNEKRAMHFCEHHSNNRTSEPVLTSRCGTCAAFEGAANPHEESICISHAFAETQRKPRDLSEITQGHLIYDRDEFEVQKGGMVTMRTRTQVHVRFAPERSQVMTRQQRILQAPAIIEVGSHMYRRATSDLE